MYKVIITNIAIIIIIMEP